MELMLPGHTFIYELFDPRNPETAMYVGKGTERRAQQHWKTFIKTGRAVNRLLKQWLEKLKSENVEPHHRLVYSTLNEVWADAEQWRIRYWRPLNPNLCNVSKGGNDWNLTSEERAEIGKRSLVLMRQRFSPEERRLWSVKAGNNPNTLEALRKARTVEHQRKAGSIGGKIGGVLGGTKGGKMRQEKYRGTPEQHEWCVKAGKRAFELTGCHLTDEGRRSNGLNGSRENRAKRGSLGMHNRWHTRRGIWNLKNCDLCREEYAFRSDFAC